MIYSKDNLRQIFQQPFNANEWQQMLRHYFQATELRAEPERIDGTPEDSQGFYLGAIDTTDSYRIGLFYYQIQHGNVARKRVGLRNLVKSFVNPNWGEFDAALVVFDSGELWRLSFVCDIKGESTAPKRYTYVFGEGGSFYNTPVFSSQLQLVTICHRLIAFFQSSVFQYLPIVSWIGAVGQHCAHIYNGEVPFLFLVMISMCI